MLFIGDCSVTSSSSFLALNDLIGCCNNGRNSAANFSMSVFSSRSYFVVGVFKHCFLIGVVSSFGDEVFSNLSNGFLSVIAVSSFELVCSLFSKHLIASSKISAFSIGG